MSKCHVCGVEANPDRPKQEEDFYLALTRTITLGFLGLVGMLIAYSVVFHWSDLWAAARGVVNLPK